MTVAKFVQPLMTMDPTTYKGSIDAAFSVHNRHGGSFAPWEQDTPDMTVHVAAGYLWDGTTLTEVAAQNTGAIIAPVTHPRIDRIVVDSTTGAVSVIGGAENVSPVAPALSAGKLPVAQLALATSTTSIDNSLLTDERAMLTKPSAVYTPMPTVLVTGTTVALAVNTRYVLNNAGLVTATLPPSAAVGDEIEILGRGAGGFLIAQNAGQTIHDGSVPSATGTGGSVASTDAHDTVKLVCIITNTDFDVESSQGNLTVTQ